MFSIENEAPLCATIRPIRSEWGPGRTASGGEQFKRAQHDKEKKEESKLRTRRGKQVETKYMHAF